MTISSTWYDKAAAGAREYELHFAVARQGSIRTVRRTLARRGIIYFQRLLRRRTKRRIPLGKIKVRFEREEPAKKLESKIRIEGRSMLFHGKRWRAHPLGRWKLSYAKRRRKRSSRRRGPRKHAESR